MRRRAAQTHETKGMRLDTKKANEKTEYGYRYGGAARRGQKAKRSGRQALAERAASEAKFVLIAERKTQEEA